MVKCPKGQVEYTRRGISRCRKARTKGVTSNKRNLIIDRLDTIINILEKNNKSFRLPTGVPLPPPPPPPPLPTNVPVPSRRKNNKPRSPPKPSARNMLLNELRKKIAMKKID